MEGDDGRDCRVVKDGEDGGSHGGGDRVVAGWPVTGYGGVVSSYESCDNINPSSDQAIKKNMKGSKNAQPKKITSFFKRQSGDITDNTNIEAKRSKVSTDQQEHECYNQSNVGPAETSVPNNVDVNANSLERDPRKRQPIWNYPPNQKEQVRLKYLSVGPFQVHLTEYPGKGPQKHKRRFQYSWFSIFKNWLEYSPTTDSAYCFLCYLYSDKPNVRYGTDAFTVKGFNNWKKVNDGKHCAFLKHIGCSQHRDAVLFCDNLLNQDRHIENVIEKKSAEEVLKNRLRLKTSVDIVRWLTFQACAFRGRDETSNSKNRGNFIELLKLLASYNDEVSKVVLENAPFNSKFTSGDIQKEILSIIANKVSKHIRSEVGNSYFCVMVDEARDESKREQMAIVIRFVDKDGIIRERFLDLVHVTDTSAMTLKTNLWKTLLQYEFDTSKIRGQGYDGASNMRGEFNGLQALVIKESPYAYYVHCFAHRLQLALVAASREVIPIHQFFNRLGSIVNVICASSKRHDELQKSKAIEIRHLLELGEIKSGKGQNQIGTLKRAGDTRWGSHFHSICSLLNMFNATRLVLEGIIEDSSSYSQRGDAADAYTYLTSFEFVFIFELMGRTNILSQQLQKKSQDIGNAIELVSATKESLNDFRNNNWESFFEHVQEFSTKHKIEMPDFNSLYKSERYRPRQKDNHVSVEHFYRVDIFICAVDKQLHELASRFDDKATELLTLSSALVPRKASEMLNIDQICSLVEKYYPTDFTEHEMILLRYEFELYNAEKSKNRKLSGISSISGLCRFLVESKKCEAYGLIERLTRLILTLPVSTTTTERGFSAMNIIKNRLRNKMSDDFLSSNLVVYIEREIAEMFDSESVIDEFKDLKSRRAEL
ncbi:uncharacterized protein [Rutidosis leptorrhynchoides]|uniref:uncharacterized protein n=1 Tax=Rutidosis leptorrhynchoides TaxID=125765 RepID=UPI003A991571